MSFLKFAKWQTRRYIPVYELGAANLMMELFTVSPPLVTKASSLEAVEKPKGPESNRALRYSSILQCQTLATAAPLLAGT